MGNILICNRNWGGLVTGEHCKFKEIHLEEVWKFVKDSSKYQISNLGRFKNIQSSHILKPSIDKYGYYRLSYKDDNNQIQYKTIHRLVAEAFIANNNPELQVNHIDGDKLNNHIDNLEWVSVSGNIKHSFDLMLNPNTNPILVFDLEKNTESRYRSLKDFCKSIDNYVSVIVPLIRHSKSNPILDRYIVTIIDESRLFKLPNVVNFGKELYVYDALTNKITQYPSILTAAYFTGIRCLSCLKDRYKNKLSIIGYSISTSKNNLDFFNDIDKNIIIKERELYLNTPYRKRNINYYLYDYYKKEETKFEDQQKIVDYLNNCEPRERLYTLKNIQQSLGHGQNKSKTSLIKGFGLKSDFLLFPWFPYNEEVILSSKYGLKAPMRFYRVIIDNNEQIICGLMNLARYLKFGTDRPIKEITLENILKATNIPNLSVSRLNSPV